MCVCVCVCVCVCECVCVCVVVASVLDVHFFFIKENWICVMTRHHSESNNIDKKSSCCIVG